MSTFNNLERLGIRKQVQLESVALNDFRSVLRALFKVQPDEVCHLAGQSSVSLSFEQPVETQESIYAATLNLLEAIRFTGRKIRFYNASSSECFGDLKGAAADEETPFRPTSPYAVAKSAAFWQVANYREAYDLFACSGILFNHESPLRPEHFVTKKIGALSSLQRKRLEMAASVSVLERMRNQLRALYESEGYRIESMNTDGERAQVCLLWDERFRPRCGQCGHSMRINRKAPQSALDLPLGPASFVGLLYEAVQGFCRSCRRYETVRPLGIVEQHAATLRLMRQVSLLCRWLPVTRVCEVVAVTPATAYRYDRYILQTELPAPCLEGLEASGWPRAAVRTRWQASSPNSAPGRRPGSLLSASTAAAPIVRPSKLTFRRPTSSSTNSIWISNLGEVIDKVRRRTQAQANAEGRAFLKGQRYNLLRNPENLSTEGRLQLDLLLEANRDLSVTYLLKDAFKAVWTYTYRRCADKRLTGWIQMALESGVAELARFARGLEEAREQILNFCQHRITSARIEAFNTIVSHVMHKACGVANLDFLFLKLRQESLQR